MGSTPKYGIYYDDPEMLALGRTQDVKQAQSIETALNQVVAEASPYKPEKVNGALDLQTASSGVRVASNANEAQEAKLPDFFPSSVDNTRIGSQGAVQEVQSLTGRSFLRTQYQGQYSAWVETTQGNSERELSRQRLLSRKGGVIGTGDKGVIALRFDGDIASFAEQILPLLKERGIPFSFAAVGTQLSADAATLQSMIIDAGGELWVKGATGTNASGMGDVYSELIGVKKTFAAACPKIPVDCFVPEYGTNYDGYMLSNDLRKYYQSFAGQQVLRTYGLVGGFDTQAYWYELNGVMNDGFNVYDAFKYTTIGQYTFRSEVARNNKVGLVMRHTVDGVIDTVTIPLFTQYLDYLVEARVTEVLELLTVSGMAAADKRHAQRHDLIMRHESQVNTAEYSETITDPQYRLGVPGSTRLLSALVQGTPGATVVSTVMGVEQTHIIPESGYLDLRRAVTIPLDIAASFSVKISGYSKDVHFYAV